MVQRVLSLVLFVVFADVGARRKSVAEFLAALLVDDGKMSSDRLADDTDLGQLGGNTARDFVNTEGRQLVLVLGEALAEFVDGAVPETEGAILLGVHSAL